MRRYRGWKAPMGAALALALALALGGCTTAQDASVGVSNVFANTGERLGAPWGGAQPRSPETGATIDRVRGVAAAAPPLEVEPGDVWPAAEAPRATLANPDAALRNIPVYRPGELDRMSAPAGRSEWQPTDPPAVRGAPADLGGSSSPPPPPLAPIDRPAPRASAAPLPPVASAPRTEGRVIQTPRGAYVNNGGTGRSQTVVGPNGQVGTATSDGNTTTILTPGGGVQVVPNPR